MPLEDRVSNSVRAYRVARGWSQAELAQRTGISRAGISAIEIGRLVPSASAALMLASVFSCRVEDLFRLEATAGKQTQWAWDPPAEVCRYWQAEFPGRRLLYPVEATGLGEVGHDGVYRQGQFQEHALVDPSQTLVMACCDPAVAILATELAHRGAVRLVALQRCSGAAMSLLKQGLVHVAGVHLARVSRSGGNAAILRASVGPGYGLLHLAQWEEGVALAPGLGIRTIREALAARLRWVGREPGSAARQWLDELFADRRPPRRLAYDHRGVAQAIRCGWADAGICHRLVSDEAGLDFLTFQQEVYDLCWPLEMEGDPRLQSLLAAVRSPTYRGLLSELPGYDSCHTGEVESVT
jgi:molybdate-binding protein/DNA-binding XRE family transcriptional regulator